MESDTGKFKEIKTYSRLSKTTRSYQPAPKLHITEPLSSKEAIRLLLDGTLRLRVCRYCLNIANNLSELDEIIVLAGKCGLFEVTIKDIIAAFYPVQITYDENFPNKICKTCLDKALQCYLFTQQCEQVERALRNYFEDINEKFYKLDPVEPLKKRGKRKLNPNHNVIYTEYKNVIEYAEPIMNLINLNALTTNSESDELECPKCWQVLPNQLSLVNHEKSHPKTMWYHCKQCGKAFVKYSQLKKHKRQAHLEEIQNVQPDVIFTCKQCGVTNTSLGQHLLHIEKHRFTQNLDDLIMNKKDNCAICFDKSGNMTSLNEPMYLHGGSPGLTGEKSIFSIVSTVLPDRSYKYRELLVPTKAYKLRILERKTETLESPVKKVKYTLENIGNQNVTSEKIKNFVFSKPETIRFILTDYEDGNTMVFQGKFNNNINVITRPNCDINGNENIDVFPVQPIKEIMPTIMPTDPGESKIHHNFTEIPSLEIIEKNSLDIDNEADTVIRSCKICWIFKQPMCTTCKNDIDKTIVDNGRPVTQKKCDFCYIFSEVGFCDICKNVLSIENNDCIRNKTTELKLDEVKTKAIEWQCKVCLTKNINRETCICCDEKRILNKDFKVVFQTDNIFLQSNTFKDNIEDKHMAYTEKKQFSINIVKDKSNEDETCNPEGNISKEHETRVANCNKEFNIECNSGDEMCPMEIEVESNIAHEELMDVTFEDETIFTENMQNTIMEHDSISNTNNTDTMQTQKMFQFEVINDKVSSENQTWKQQSISFNIGVEDIERKRKKPIRRIRCLGNNICQNCLNKLITSYVFILNVRNNRDRIDKCINAMIDTLENVDETKNVLIEISQNAILPAIDEKEDISLNDEHKEEFLEDEFRIPESDSESDIQSNHSTSSDDIIIENPAKNVTKTYGKKILVNGYQQCMKSDYLDEFLTFKSQMKRQICKYICPVCSKHFISDYFLKKHILRHTFKTAECKVCLKKFKSRFYLTEHYKMVHVLNMEQFSCCSVCGRSFKDPKKLKKHFQIHFNKECQLCDKFFKSQAHYNTHMQRHFVKFNTNRNSVQTCSFCEKDCSNENELSLHVNKVHLQMKPYSCDMCEKQFYTEYNLISHKKLHSLKSNEDCSFCHRVFKCRKNLVVHLRKHLNIKPHYCPVCTKSFYSESSMKCHMKKFHGGRYCCRLCRHVVDSNTDFKHHLKVAHSCM